MYIVPCNFKVLRLYLILISGTEAKECFYLKMKNANATILELMYASQITQSSSYEFPTYATSWLP
ncbi:hypothetical protein T4D_2711 [Trichinella pseudospiralis]|uniref:Uncharacterized protein n=1 Tax=Trichinella pseudospiralis TaxID=6337 RepID=A0A0V1FT26_TRIPS|nr:hypothetical protein T4D_2711 [Trichinella pseudospiralis]